MKLLLMLTFFGLVSGMMVKAEEDDDNPPGLKEANEHPRDPKKYDSSISESDNPPGLADFLSKNPPKNFKEEKSNLKDFSSEIEEILKGIQDKSRPFDLAQKTEFRRRKRRQFLEKFIVEMGEKLEKDKIDSTLGNIKMQPGLISNFDGSRLMANSELGISESEAATARPANVHGYAGGGRVVEFTDSETGNPVQVVTFDPIGQRRESIKQINAREEREEKEKNKKPLDVFNELVGEKRAKSFHNTTQIVQRSELIDPELSTDPFLFSTPTNNTLKANEADVAKVKLGRLLFFDENLSADGKVSCATCHDPDKGFADGREFPLGIYKEVAGNRNTPTILNVVYRDQFFWDGRSKSLEDQALKPFFHPIEMGLQNKEQLLKKINKNPDRYGNLFEKAFKQKPSAENVAKAISSFERTVVTGESPVDKFLDGNKRALNESQQRGLFVYSTKGKCIGCHRFDHDFTTPNGENMLMDTGLFEFSGNESPKLNVPTLRNVQETAPYFHNGSIDDLETVVELYNNGASFDRPGVSKLTKEPLNLTDREKRDLVEFLKALTGPVAFEKDS